MSDKDDGVALTAIGHPPLITDEMLAAGRRVMTTSLYTNHERLLTDIYTAMFFAQPRCQTRTTGPQMSPSRQ